MTEKTIAFYPSCKQPAGAYHRDRCRAWEETRTLDLDSGNRVLLALRHLGALPEERLRDVLAAAAVAAYEKIHRISKNLPFDEISRVEARLTRQVARVRLLAARAKEYTLPGPRLLLVEHLRGLAGALEELATDIERGDG